MRHKSACRNGRGREFGAQSSDICLDVFAGSHQDMPGLSGRLIGEQAPTVLPDDALARLEALEQAQSTPAPPPKQISTPLVSTPEADGVPSLEDKRQARIAHQQATPHPAELSKGWQARGEALNAYAEAYLQAKAEGASICD